MKFAIEPVLGRCVGYGAFPVFNNTGAYAPKPASHVPLEPAANFPNGYVQTGDDGLVYANGYVVLTLGAGTGTLYYYQVNYSGIIADATSQPALVRAAASLAGRLGKSMIEQTRRRPNSPSNLAKVPRKPITLEVDLTQK